MWTNISLLLMLIRIVTKGWCNTFWFCLTFSSRSIDKSLEKFSLKLVKSGIKHMLCNANLFKVEISNLWLSHWQDSLRTKPLYHLFWVKICLNFYREMLDRWLLAIFLIFALLGLLCWIINVVNIFTLLLIRHGRYKSLLLCWNPTCTFVRYS